MSILRKIYKWIGTKQGLLIFGFILTTILGSLVTYQFQSMTWKRETSFQIFKESYTEGTLLVDELSNLIGERYFLLQRFKWSIDNKKLDATKTREMETAYFRKVIDWNTKYWKYRNRIRILIDDTTANHFLDYADSARQSPRSIHYRFVKTHSKIQGYRNNNIDSLQAQLYIDTLNQTCRFFIERLTDNFKAKTEQLKSID